MRFLTVLLACGMTIAGLPAAEAADRRAGSKARHYGYGYQGKHDYRRSSTVDRNGLCVRDTGRPLNSLNLNHRCDREEFWARFNDMGDSRR